MTDDTYVTWSFNQVTAMLCVIKPFDQKEATVGNGVMAALQAEAPQAVDALHAKALALGAANEGDPGFRSDNFYGANFRDLDGNKFNFFCYT